MRWQWVFGFLLMALGAARPASAFLTSGDPDNFFLLLEKASVVATVQVSRTMPPAAKQPYFLYELKKTGLLRGQAEEGSFKVAEEAMIPGQKPLLGAKQEALVFLDPIPDFTAYRALRSQGYAWRILGGKRGVWPAEVSETARAYLAASAQERNALVLALLKGEPMVLRPDAVIWLVRRGPLALSAEQAEALVGFASAASGNLSAAAVQILDQSDNAAARQALHKLAEGPSGTAKWAAIRALEKKGQGPPVDRLAEDYRNADASGRSQALALIAARKDSEALAFFGNLLGGPSDFEAKREAIQKMGEQKNPGFERLLIQQIGKAEESVQAESILALGKMKSSEAVPSILPLLDSRSEKLRGAAFFMLVDSPDPRAQALISQRYERDHHGGWVQNPHFYGNPR